MKRQPHNDMRPPSPAVGGDEHSEWVRQALETFERPLVGYAIKLTNGNLELARDAVQDTFLRLCRQRREAIAGHEAGWLFRVCRNRVFELLRKEKRLVPLEEGEMHQPPAGEPTPAGAASQRDDLKAVLDIVETLPRNQQEVVRLKFAHEMSYKEISDVTGLSVSNVGYLLHTALRSVRARIQAADAGSGEGS